MCISYKSTARARKSVTRSREKESCRKKQTINRAALEKGDKTFIDERVRK